MTLAIRTLPRMRLATMRHTGAYGHPGLTELWERFGAWCAANRLNDPRPKFYGFSHDDPACTPPEQCRYDAAVQIGVGLRTGPDVQVMDYEGGDYACMHFVGTGPEIATAWAQMGAPDQIPRWLGMGTACCAGDLRRGLCGGPGHWALSVLAVHPSQAGALKPVGRR